MPSAYIYRRFSTDEQERGSGDTLTRQQERCEAFAAERGWTILEVLTDRGRSAFKGEHLQPDAALGRFVAQVTRGEIERGSVLIAERLDRLSRRPVGEAMAWIHMLASAGVVVAVADTRSVFDANPDLGAFLNAAIQLGVGHDESRKKSDQTRLAKQKLWKLAQSKSGSWTNLATKLPSWLERTPTRDGWIINEERAQIVRDIFEQSANGVGVNTITRLLNEDGVQPFAAPIRYKGLPARWGRSAVRQLLISPNVEGDLVFRAGMFAGQTIHDFFPRIVDADLVARARDGLKSRKKEQGLSARGGSANLFAGITACGHCGRRAFLTTSRQKGKAYTYLRCEAAQEGRCDNRGGYSYGALEQTVLDIFLDLSMDDRLFEATDDLRRSRIQKAELEKAISERRAKKHRLMEAFGDGDPDALSLIDKIKSEISSLRNDLTDVEAAIRTASGQVRNSEHLKRIRDIREAALSESETVRIQARSKLRLALCSIIQSVDLDRDHEGGKVFTVILKGGVMAVRLDTGGRVLKSVSEVGGQPLWHYLSEEQKNAIAPLITRIQSLAR